MKTVAVVFLALICVLVVTPTSLQAGDHAVPYSVSPYYYPNYGGYYGPRYGRHFGYGYFRPHYGYGFRPLRRLARFLGRAGFFAAGATFATARGAVSVAVFGRRFH